MIKTSDFIKKIGLMGYIKTRILSPKQIIYGFKHWREMFNTFSIRNALFCARYEAGPSKCIEGYDFI